VPFVPFCGLDRFDLFGERSAKLRENVDQQVDFREADAPVPFRSEKEFELDHSLAIGDKHHVVAPLIGTVLACLDVRLNVRGQMS